MSAGNASSSQGGDALATVIPLATVAILAVILRFVARAKTANGFGLDDMFVVASLVSFLVIVAMTIWAYAAGVYDKDVQDLSPAQLKISLMTFYISPLFSVPAITFAKLSLLSLYHRIFSTKTFRRWIYVVGATCVAWAIACFFVAVFRCYPIKVSLDPILYVTRQDLCLNFLMFFMVIEPINCLQDLIIVVMPLNIIRKLRLPLAKRIWLSVIFALGGFVCVTSILRIVYSWTPGASSLNGIIRSGKWLQLQLAFAIIGANLPVYGPLLPDVGVVRTRLSTWYSQLLRTSSSRNAASVTRRNSEDTDKYSDQSSTTTMQMDGITMNPKSSSVRGVEGANINTIQVERTYQVERV